MTLLLTLLGEKLFEGMLGVSLLYFARGVGTGVGPILARKLANDDPKREEWLITFGFLCGSVFYLPIHWVSSFYLTMLLISLAHLGGAAVWVFSTIRLQQVIPSEIQGRVFAFEFAFWTLMFVISNVCYAHLSDSLMYDPRTLLSIIGGTLLLPFIFWLYRMLRSRNAN